MPARILIYNYILTSKFHVADERSMTLPTALVDPVGSATSDGKKEVKSSPLMKAKRSY